MFNIPVKEIIVNDDSQVRLLEDDGTAYADNDTTPTTGGVIFEGFTGLISATAFRLLAAATRIIKTAFSAGTAEVVTYVLTNISASAAQHSVFRLVYESMELTPVEQQNQPVEKRYQLSVACTTVDAIGTEIAARINADKYAPVTAVYTSGTDSLALTAKTVGVKIRLYGDILSGAALTVTTPGALPVNTHAHLKNINWAKNFDIDRDINWMPLPGVNYNSFYFEVIGVNPGTLGNEPVPSEAQNDVITAYRLYVKDGTTLETALDLLVGDLNA